MIKINLILATNKIKEAVLFLTMKELIGSVHQFLHQNSVCNLMKLQERLLTTRKIGGVSPVLFSNAMPLQIKLEFFQKKEIEFEWMRIRTVPV